MHAVTDSIAAMCTYVARGRASSSSMRTFRACSPAHRFTCRPANSVLFRRGQLVPAQAEKGEEGTTSSNEAPSQAPLNADSQSGQENISKGLRPGQGTAIVTGAISILLGLAYIAISTVLDSRGELQPPPPEAFL